MMKITDLETAGHMRDRALSILQVLAEREPRSSEVAALDQAFMAQAKTGDAPAWMLLTAAAEMAKAGMDVREGAIVKVRKQIR